MNQARYPGDVSNIVHYLPPAHWRGRAREALRLTEAPRTRAEFFAGLALMTLSSVIVFVVLVGVARVLLRLVGVVH